MFSNHIKGVCNALVESASNAMAERLNGKIQIIKTIGRGYRNFTNFRSAILVFNGGLNLYPHSLRVEPKLQIKKTTIISSFIFIIWIKVEGDIKFESIERRSR